MAKSQIPLRYLVRSWSPTSFELASVMEFGFNCFQEFSSQRHACYVGYTRTHQEMR